MYLESLDVSRKEIVCSAGITASEVGYFPQTRYYGSKRRLVPWLKSMLDNYKFHTVLDVFGGTGTVSLMFKSMGKHVFYNDLLNSSRLQASALLSNEVSHDLIDLVEGFCADVIPIEAFITSTFQGVYYTHDENMWLDGALASIQKVADLDKFACIFYCLQQACLQNRPFNLFHRKNLYLRENNKKDTKFGNWRTWERSFQELMLRAASELMKSRWKSQDEPVILPCQDAIDLSSGYDLVYLDPPYIPSRRKDISYLERYHFLEGLSAPTLWADLIDWNKESRVFKPTDAMRKWNTKSTFRDNLFELVEKHKESVVALSYVESAYPEKEDIIDFFKSCFGKVSIYEQKLSHALSRNKKTELLIVGGR